MCRVLCVLLICVSFVNVDSMALKGPALTRYDPCGLGMVHFDRKTDQFWDGIIDFGLYLSLVDVETEIYFEEPVTVLQSINGSFYLKSNSSTTLILKHAAPIPKQYIFRVQVVNPNKTDIPIVSKFVLNKVTLCSTDIKASQTITSLNATNVNLFGDHYAHVCGRRSLHHTELVSVGTEAKAGDWPWHVAMLIREPLTLFAKYDCGGNIISRTAVLTAGHCIFKNGKLLEPDRVAVVAGTNNYKDLDQVGRQLLVADKLILHPAYNDEFSTSDLGIIKVNKFYYTEFVQPICLWGPAYDKTLLFEKEATVVGFGSTEDNKQADVLRVANTKVQNDSTCIAFDPPVYAKLMDEFTFCAGYGPTSAVNPRNGDSGGGLVLSTIQPDHKISWMLRGVLSKCGVSPNQEECDPTYYVVYTDVGPHYGWISHHSGLQFRVNVA